MTDFNKKKHKRWGRKFNDSRDWQEYNEHLIKRGEYFLAFDFVEGWNDELSAINCGKVGAPYQFPNTLIKLQALWHAKQLPYRMIEGITRDLAQMGHLPEYNDYSTVNRRVNEMDYCLAPPQSNDMVIFSDSTGMQTVNGGEYLREKYGKKNRRWIQIILLGDAKHHEPISYEIRLIPASEPESTERQLITLLKKGADIIAAGGDGALDDKHLWNFCNNRGIKPIIKPDQNARDDTDCATRNQEVKLKNKLGYKKWSKQRGYGLRWTATEGVFSAIKRIFGEQVKATSEKGMLQEAACKIWAYQRMQRV